MRLLWGECWLVDCSLAFLCVYDTFAPGLFAAFVVRSRLCVRVVRCGFRLVRVLCIRAYVCCIRFGSRLRFVSLQFCKRSTSPPGGNQVDGLPPALSLQFCSRMCNLNRSAIMFFVACCGFFWFCRICVAFACCGPAPVGIFLGYQQRSRLRRSVVFAMLSRFFWASGFWHLRCILYFNDFVSVYRGFVSILIFGCCWFACGSYVCFLRLCACPTRVCLGSFGIRCAVDAFVSFLDALFCRAVVGAHFCCALRSRLLFIVAVLQCVAPAFCRCGSCRLLLRCCVFFSSCGCCIRSFSCS